MISATVFNIQRFSLHDGPGIRTTVFLKGCPLRCVWCHNPESFDPRPEPGIADHRCIACGSCVTVCQQQLTGPVTAGSPVNRPDHHCTRCGECAAACPTETRQMLGRRVSVGELLEELDRDRPYHEESAGGITFSGGEPLSTTNAAFTIECLRRLSQQGVSTAVDTCGHIPPEILAHAAQHADLFLFDLKIMDPAHHREATGQDNALILENLNWLVAEGHRVQLRLPLIPGWNDSPENLDAVAAHVRTLAAETGRGLAAGPSNAAGLSNAAGQGQVPDRDLPAIHLLPYHGIAGDKYRRLGRVNPLADLETMTAAQVQACARQLQEHGLVVHIGG